MIVGIQGHLSHPAKQFAEGGRTREIRAQHQGIDEAADQRVDFEPVAVGDRCAHDDVVLSRIAAKQDLECRQQRHEQAGAFLLAQHAKGCHQRVGKYDPFECPDIALLCRPRIVRGDVLAVRKVGEALLPVGKLRLENILRQPIPLPLHEITIADGQLAPTRGLSPATGSVGLG